MGTLIYKRTHPGDPDRKGRFGIGDCMGPVRTWRFDAVIGVGGIGAEPRSHCLDGKVNWIGIGPHRVGTARRGPVLTFDHFWLRDSRGPSLREFAPRLADRIYSKNVRVLIDDLDEQERAEVRRILDLAKDAPPSAVDRPASTTPSEKCRPRKQPSKPIKDCSR
jgi:hypothetical protein